MTTVRETLEPNTRVDLFVAGEDGTRVEDPDVGGLPVAPIVIYTDPVTGEWEADLDANSTIDPAGTVWARVESKGGDQSTSYGLVPVSGSILDWDDLLTDPPGALASSALVAHQALRGPGGHLPDGTPADGEAPLWNEGLGLFEYGLPPAALHAASHADGGTDEVTLTQAQVTGLVTDLAAKATPADITAAVTALVNGAPIGGDTLGELDARLAIIEALGSLATDAELASNLAAILGSATSDADTLGELEALNGLRMLKSANLSDLANAATARTNLDVYSKAAVDALIAALVDGQVFTGEVEAPSFKATGKPGLTGTPIILAGGLASGIPTGAHLKGEIAWRDDGTMIYCTVSGTPGTWVDAYGQALLDLPQLEVLDDLTLDVLTDPTKAKIGRNPINAQSFSAVGTATWIKPSTGTWLIGLLIGSGGGGASGRKGAGGTARFGGGGGQSGLVSYVILPLSVCGATEVVTIGAAGTGGAAQATNSTNGVAGVSGGQSSFGSLAVASGGMNGASGTNVTGYGGNDPTAPVTASKRGSFRAEPGGSAITTGTPAAPKGGHTGSGGAGGSISAADAALAGGNGAGSVGAGAATGGAAGVNGNPGAAGSGGTGGAGGSGGGAGSGGNGGAGGAGGDPGGGGGGGGAAVDSVGNSGAGGAGAKGFAAFVVI